MKIFPTLAGRRRGCVNLDACARYHWNTDLGVKAPTVSPFLEPFMCQDLVQAQHTSRNLYWSWGGYMEKRPTLWAGSYLAKTGKWLHLGVDFNVFAGTPVTVPNYSKVLLIDDDTPEEHGWGNRIIMKDVDRNLYVIYAHLSPHIECKVGDMLMPGWVFGTVGKSEHNGGWFPHLHMQVMTPPAWQHYRTRSNIKELDGYGHPSQEKQLREWFPNPVVVLDL